MTLAKQTVRALIPIAWILFIYSPSPFLTVFWLLKRHGSLSIYSQCITSVGYDQVHYGQKITCLQIKRYLYYRYTIRLKAFSIWNACKVYSVEWVFEIKYFPSIICYAIYRTVWFQLIHFFVDCWEYMYFILLSSSTGNINHEPLSILQEHKLIILSPPASKKYIETIRGNNRPLHMLSRILRRPSSVRDITKSSSTFSATNISSNIAWLLQLHDTIQMKSIFVTKFSSIYLTEGEKRLVFRLSFVNLQRAKDGTPMFDVKYRHVSVV